jgi:hypothetical protein
MDNHTHGAQTMHVLAVVAHSPLDNRATIARTPRTRLSTAPTGPTTIGDFFDRLRQRHPVRAPIC